MRGAQKERETEMYARELRRIWKAVPAIVLVALLLGNMIGLAEGEEQMCIRDSFLKYSKYNTFCMDNAINDWPHHGKMTRNDAR